MVDIAVQRFALYGLRVALSVQTASVVSIGNAVNIRCEGRNLRVVAWFHDLVQGAPLHGFVWEDM